MYLLQRLLLLRREHPDFISGLLAVLVVSAHYQNVSVGQVLTARVPMKAPVVSTLVLKLFQVPHFHKSPLLEISIILPNLGSESLKEVNKSLLIHLPLLFLRP